MKTLLSIGFIWLGCALAWLILGTTLVARTGSASGDLHDDVYALWGPPLEQLPPTASYTTKRVRSETVTTEGAQGGPVTRTVQREEDVEVPVPLEQSRVAVNLALEHRRKGLLWFPTYAVDLKATYAFVNPDAEPRDVEVVFPLSENNVGFDAFEVRAADGTPVRASVDRGAARWTARLSPGERAAWTVAYRSRGTQRFGYALTHGTGEARDAELTVTSNEPRVDFPAGTLSPTRHGPEAGGGWKGTWRFERLIASRGVAVELPGRLNPGPLASRITFFAPVGLLFFFFVVALLAYRARVALHPMHYFLLGCAFFAFHLLFAYLVDHVSIAPALALASLVSTGLVVSYARLFVGGRFALREVGLSQVVYLVLFSLSFLWEGYTGLAITLGAILTLFFVMQVTGRVDWRALEVRPKAPVPSSP